MTHRQVNQLRHFEIRDSIVDKAYGLSSLLMYQYDVDSLKHPVGVHWCMFVSDFQERFASSFMKELVGFAGILRTLLDVESISLPIENAEYGFDQSVGLLNRNNHEEPLSFREVCNKIIHANQYEIQLNYSDTHPLDNGRNGYGSDQEDYKNPIIATYGEHRNNPWVSEISFLKFINTATNLPDGG